MELRNKIPTSAEELKRRRGRSWLSAVNIHHGVVFQNVSNYTDRTVLPPKSLSSEMLAANPPEVSGNEKNERDASSARSLITLFIRRSIMVF